MSWFKIVKTTGREAGRGHFNDQNQWSSSMIKCKSKSISFSRISLQSVCLSVCGLQVIKKVIKGNERRPVETARGRESLIILSIFYMNFHNAIMRPVWQKSILSRVPAYLTALRGDGLQKRKKKTLSLGDQSFAQWHKSFHTYTCGKKKQLITRGCFTLGALKEMERAARRGRTSHHYLCVHTRNLLLQSAAAAVSNLAVPLQHQQGLDRPFSLIVP